MAARTIKESDLYEPVKRLLEAQGYEVKAEIGAADVVACRAGEPPLIVELKAGFSLALYHQAIERQALTDTVYIAVARGTGRAFQRALVENLALCRRLGLGLVTVRTGDRHTEIHCDPAPYRPRKSRVKTGRLLKEFARRVGDPNTGGMVRRGLVTAYRQDALRCAALLAADGPTKAAAVAAKTGVDKARRLMADDHYGWFERIATGVYALTPKGHQALVDHRAHVDAIALADARTARPVAVRPGSASPPTAKAAA